MQTQTESTRFCKDCAHHTTYFCGPHQCSAPALGLNLVTGESNTQSCADMRNAGRSGYGEGACGPGGKLFTAKSGPVKPGVNGVSNSTQGG
jgi:hypothetical protein